MYDTTALRFAKTGRYCTLKFKFQICAFQTSNLKAQPGLLAAAAQATCKWVAPVLGMQSNAVRADAVRTDFLDL